MEIWGPYALFTRPEAKTERVSYPVPTPNAAAGILRAVFWKPEIDFRVSMIEVLNPVAWHRITRNEVSSVVTREWASKAMADPAVRFDAAADRDQRSALFLKDVHYRIHAWIQVHPGARANATAYREQFQRRLARGACFNQPCLGTRECVAEGFGPARSKQALRGYTENLGPMLHSIDIREDGSETYSWYMPHIVDGVISVTGAGAQLPGDTEFGRRARA